MTLAVVIMEDVKEAASAGMVVGLERHLTPNCPCATFLVDILTLSSFSASAKETLHLKPAVLCVAAIHVEVSDPVMVFQLGG